MNYNMKSKNWKVGLLALALCLTGCSRKIEGEAFIVTKDRSTIKLSLLEVLLIPKENFVAFKAGMEPKLDAAKKRKADNETALVRISNELMKNGTDFEPINKEMDQLSKAVNEVLNDQNLAHDAKVRWATNAQARIKELNSSAAPFREKIEELKNRHDSLQAQAEKINKEISSLREEIFDIPGTIRVKTNSDAKFSCNVPRGEYVIFAQTERKVFDETETYTWLLENAGEFVALNNDNLTK